MSCAAPGTHGKFHLMKRLFKRLIRTLGALFLITLISVGVGAAHYVYRGGNFSELIGKTTHFVRTWPEYLWGTTFLEEGREVVQTVTEQVRNTTQEVLPPSIPPDQTTTVTPPTPKIHVYFAPCIPEEPGSLDDAFETLLRDARKSIVGAFFEIQLQKIADILVQKHQDGVEVRLVSDSDYRDREAVQTCMRAGIPVIFDNRSAFMHNKFCVVDGTRVWTGSTNLTENCFYRNNNNAILIDSPQLASDYTTEFEELFTQQMFGKKDAPKTPYPEVILDDSQIECYFSPEDQIQTHILTTIQTAQLSIDFLAFAFTAKPLAAAMVDRIKTGVTVRGVFETRNANALPSQDEYLAQAGAQVKLDTNPATMHDKVIIIDGTVVVTGSYNFTKAADTSNDENCLIIHSADIARQYSREFERIFNAP